MNRTFALAALLSLPLLTSPVFARPDCLELGRIYNWKALDNKTLIVEDDTHQKFKLSLMGYCPNLTFKERVAFKSIGGSQLTCLTRGDEVDVRDIGIPARCPIIGIVSYTAEMEKADKAAAAARAQESR